MEKSNISTKIAAICAIFGIGSTAVVWLSLYFGLGGIDEKTRLKRPEVPKFTHMLHSCQVSCFSHILDLITVNRLVEKTDFGCKCNGTILMRLATLHSAPLREQFILGPLVINRLKMFKDFAGNLLIFP